MADLTLQKYDLTGKTQGTITLDPAVFGVSANPTLLHQVIVSQLANSRSAIAHVRDRSDVSGGGKKPWRQKGTGNARAGSTRSPLWRGGGITFGPSNQRNFSKRLPQKMRQAAIRSALSDKLAQNQIVIITSLESLTGKTKEWVTAYNSLPHPTSAALILSGPRIFEAERAIRNLPSQKYATVSHATLYDIVRYPILVMTEDALKSLTERLKSSKKSAPATVGAEE